jgi:hypothetical protein
LPNSREGLLQCYERTARQAASLEEEAKRREGDAFYFAKEADLLEGGLAHRLFTFRLAAVQQWKLLRLPCASALAALDTRLTCSC